MRDAWLDYKKPLTAEELDTLDALLAKLRREVPEQAGKIAEVHLIVLEKKEGGEIIADRLN